jgi:hypothetical protein
VSVRGVVCCNPRDLVDELCSGFEEACCGTAFPNPFDCCLLMPHEDDCLCTLVEEGGYRVCGDNAFACADSCGESAKGLWEWFAAVSPDILLTVEDAIGTNAANASVAVNILSEQLLSADGFACDCSVCISKKNNRPSKL